MGTARERGPSLQSWQGRLGPREERPPPKPPLSSRARRELEGPGEETASGLTGKLAMPLVVPESQEPPSQSHSPGGTLSCVSPAPGTGCGLSEAEHGKSCFWSGLTPLPRFPCLGLFRSEAPGHAHVSPKSCQGVTGDRGGCPFLLLCTNLNRTLIISVEVCAQDTCVGSLTSPAFLKKVPLPETDTMKHAASSLLFCSVRIVSASPARGLPQSVERVCPRKSQIGTFTAALSPVAGKG